MDEPTCSHFIIGAGAAGMMTAISAALHGAKNIIVANATPRIGLKILMAGGGRCNITNAKLSLDKYYGESTKAIRKVILQFPPEKMIEFLQQEGLKVKVEEPWSKYFPVDDKAQSVLDVLLQKLDKLSVKLMYPCQITDFFRVEDGWKIVCSTGEYLSKNVILACGGFSYPHTGSDGRLWNVVRKHGITMEKPYPALTPLKTADQDCHKLSGITQWVTISVKKQQKTIFCEGNSLLFTHTGLSGPGILDVSQWFTQGINDYHLEISFLPESSIEATEAEILQMMKTRAKGKLFNYVSEKLPKRLAEFVLSRSEIDLEQTFGEFPKKQRKALLKNLFAFCPKIVGHSGYKKAEVTAGGITFSEINLRTMELKKHPNLFAVGEIVNVHGDIGGYNFQWAWSSGWVCGKGLAQQD